MTAEGRGAFYRVRITLLLTALACVAVWAIHDVTSRRARNTWTRTLDVGVILVRTAPLDPDAAAAVRDRLPALEARLETEMRRYRPAGPRPFRFTLFGPVDGGEPPQARGDGIVDGAFHAYDLWRYRRDVDRRAGVVPARFASRIYLAARPPASATRHSVEGESEDGGRIGTVSVELAPSMADLALAVVAHELLHTLGATDKYDATGAALVPTGLAEPDREPRYPQRFVEVMARGRPVAPGDERLPETVDDLAVGATTAAEIGWTAPHGR